MQALIDRIGIPEFIHIIIQLWNFVFLIIMIVSVVISRRKVEYDTESRKLDLPFTKEILIFLVMIFMYNFFDVMCTAMKGETSKFGFFAVQASFIGYFAVGSAQMIFFLQLIKINIADKIGSVKLRFATSGVQHMQIPCLFLLFITPFTGAFYYFDQYNMYHRGPYYIFLYMVMVISFIYIFIVFILFRKNVDPFFGKMTFVASLTPLTTFLLRLIYKGPSYNNISVSITALIIFLLYEQNKTAISVNNAHELEKSKQELQENKIKLLVAQIQPHFIYNSLMALQSKCTHNPELYEGISSFGKYLRANLTAMTENTLIPFKDELKHIKAYLQLERLNFGDKLRVEYDIEIDDFMVPSFCVEPLVENAVRYGIGTYKNGGLVKINVYDEPDYIMIEVWDDGSGGNKLTDVQKDRKSIGIENVRLRLKAMDKGELSITQNEKGTSAVIRLKPTAML